MCVLKGCVSFFLRAPLMCAETGNNQKGFKGLRKVFFPLEVAFRGNVNYVWSVWRRDQEKKIYNQVQPHFIYSSTALVRVITG